jgi:hypothetical protein
VRDLASEIRTDVRGSVEDLRAELKSAARDVRRESRHQARTQRRAGNATPGRSDLERMAEWFRDEVRDVARRNKPTDADVAALKQVLENAMDEVRRVLGGTDRR